MGQDHTRYCPHISEGSLHSSQRAELHQESNLRASLSHMQGTGACVLRQAQGPSAAQQQNEQTKRACPCVEAKQSM
jgi:hypothetical protein